MPVDAPSYNAVPMSFEGMEFPSKTALARHLVRRYGWSPEYINRIATRLSPYRGEVTTETRLILHQLGAALPVPDPGPEPEPVPEVTEMRQAQARAHAAIMEAVLPKTPAAPVEIGEQLGLIRGAFAAMNEQLAAAEAAAAELRDHTPDATGLDPAVRRQLDRQSELMDQLSHGFRNLERLHAETQQHLARYEEMFNVILHKIHQLAHDVQARQPGVLPPKPTRQNPTASN